MKLLSEVDYKVVDPASRPFVSVGVLDEAVPWSSALRPAVRNSERF